MANCHRVANLMDDSCSTASSTDGRKDQLEATAPSSIDPEEQLLHTVRNCLESSRYLRKVRCEMRRKVLETIQGSEGDNMFTGGGGGSSTASPPSAIQLINQLILEYFDWYNLQYSAEMFSVESETPRLAGKVRRQTLLASLRSNLGKPLQFQPDLPVLAELIMKLVLTTVTTGEHEPTAH
ncbi:uncharacterized protein LOC131676136 [Topomyia yanbarensis]|uniref:uncharacterized protein LOC131676136 n=1 Tax=Topomyia yanbarensis TaxID=2498891 RepID=UPI00273AEBDD|nr:uncharacterized protein LOC131676136 [Topomyia yanbarensis]